MESSCWHSVYHDKSSDSIRPWQDGKGGDNEGHREDGASYEGSGLHAGVRVGSSLLRMASCCSSWADGDLLFPREHDDGGEEEAANETIEWCDRRREAFSCCCYVLS